MFAVDPTIEVAHEADEWGADLLVVHHPLFLKPVHGFAATTPKGRTIATLVGAECALLTAHTNADQAVGGVSEALATGARAHRPGPDPPGAGRPAGQADDVRPGRRRRRAAGCARRRPARAGSATTTTRRSPRRGRAGSVRSRARTRSSAPSARSRPSPRSGSRWCCRARVRGRVVARAAGGAPLRGAGVRRGRARRPRAGRHRDRPDRHGARDHAARVRRDRRVGAARDRPGRAGGRRPGPAGAPGRGVRGSGRLPARHRGGDRRRRVRDQRPAAPPGERVRRAATGRRWSTFRTGRPSGPGSRWWRRACARRWAIRWRPG